MSAPPSGMMLSMTKRVHVTDLREVKAIKVTCRQCGTGHVIPLDSRALPQICANCGTRESPALLLDLLRAVHLLNGATLPYTVEIETDETA